MVTFFLRICLQLLLSLSLLNVLPLAAPQVPSPTGQLVNSAPLEQTPAEEESRKSISRSFKGTMASSTERMIPIPISYLVSPFVSCDLRFNVVLVFLSSV